MHHAFQLPDRIHHHQRSNLLLFHQSQSRRRKLGSSNCLRTRRHPLARRQVHHIFAALLEQTPQIPIADNPNQLLAIHHGGHSQFLPRHFVNHVWHLRRRTHARQRVPGVHQRFHPRQPLSQLSSGMQIGKILFLESPPLTQRHSQRIAQRQHGCRRSRRRQSQRTSLLRHRTIQGHLCRRRQSRNQPGCPILVSRFWRDRVGTLTLIV